MYNVTVEHTHNILKLKLRLKIIYWLHKKIEIQILLDIITATAMGDIGQN